MKKILTIIITCIFYSFYIFAEEFNIRSNELDINLLEDSAVLSGETIVDFGLIKAKSNHIEKLPHEEKFIFKKNAVIYFLNKNGNVKIETTDGEIFPEESRAIIRNGFGYVQIENTTKSSPPNDKFYFGGKSINYKKNNIEVNDGWGTTDFKIIRERDPKKIGYHFLSEKINIEVNKQITLKRSNLYLGNQKIIPFNIPWLRLNIRSKSQVPLFPTVQFSGKNDFNITWGLLFGNKEDTLVGGIAPKYDRKKGLLIGRAELWNFNEKIGDSRVNIDDLLIIPILNKKKLSETEIEKLGRSYKLEFTHNYNGEKGNFSFKALNSTINNLDDLSKSIDKHTSRNNFKNLFKIKRPKYNQNMGYYNLNANLKNLGTNSDIFFKSKVKLVSDKKLFALLAYDKIEDIKFDSSIDNDLYSDLSLYKDNEEMKIGGYYNYLLDFDPGSTSSDLKSRAKDYGFQIIDKINKIELKYDEVKGDKFRKINAWEKGINPKIKLKNTFNVDINYVPTTVSEYDIYNSKNLNLNLFMISKGGYEIFPKYIFEESEKRLDLTPNGYKSRILNQDNKRSLQYNKFENVIYDKKREKKFTLDITKPNKEYSIAIGKYEEEIWDRNGIFYKVGFEENKTYVKYQNDSKFIELGGAFNNIDMRKIGKLNTYSFIRYDKYKNDSTLKLKLNLDHKVEYEETKNDIKISFQNYIYMPEKDNIKLERLSHKENIVDVENKFSTKFGNTNINYNINYLTSKKSYEKKNKIKNEIELIFENSDKLKFYNDTQKRYTSKTTSNKFYNDLKNNKYGTSYKKGDHLFDYSKESIIFDLKNIKNIENSVEKMTADNFKYVYETNENKLELLYSSGRNKIFSENKEYLDLRNQIYKFNYDIYGETENSYKIWYENYSYFYKNSQKLINNKMSNVRDKDVLKLTYEFKDKRVEEPMLLKYAELEFGKSKDKITKNDLETLKNVLNDEDAKNDYLLRDIAEEDFKYGTYRNSFKIYGIFERNKSRYEITGNLADSLSKLEGGVFYSKNRFGVAYKYKETSKWNNSNDWIKNKVEHQISLNTKFGKPSEEFNLKTYVKINNNPSITTNTGNTRSIGVELAKDFGYYSWSVDFQNKYNPTKDKSDYKVGIKFSLLAMPETDMFSARVSKEEERKFHNEFNLMNKKENKLEKIVEEELRIK